MEQEHSEARPISGDNATKDSSVEALYKQFPNPHKQYNVAVYVKYQLDCLQPEYLRELEGDYDEMLSRYEAWNFIGYYIDMAPVSKRLSELDSWIRLINDCESGKVNLILVGNAFSFNINEMYLCVRFLASLDPPVGVFFEEQNLYSLAPDSLFLAKDSLDFEIGLNKYDRRRRK